MPANASAKTIVLIDDDETVIALFYYMLVREGFKVVPFKSADEALSKLTAKKYKIDLIVMDLMMPGNGGYDTVKKLQEMEPYRNTPVFVVTARSLDSNTVELIRSEQNVNDFFNKPVDSTAFTRRVHEVLKTQKSAPAGDAD